MTVAAWNALVDASSDLKKSKCEEGTASFRGLSSHDKAQLIARKQLAVTDMLLLKGERLRDHLYRGEARQRRKAADCVFFLLRADGSALLVVVELKSGNDFEESFETQLAHATEDARVYAAQHGLVLDGVVVWGAPRLPPSVRGNRKGFQSKYPYFDVKPALGELLDAVLEDRPADAGGGR